jgi:hypothetical protein
MDGECACYRTPALAVPLDAFEYTLEFTFSRSNIAMDAVKLTNRSNWSATLVAQTTPFQLWSGHAAGSKALPTSSARKQLFKGSLHHSFKPLS